MLKVRRKIPANHKIPLNKLVPAIRAFKTSSPDSSLDSLTDYEAESIRALCGQEYASIPPEDVRTQAVNARRTGQCRLSEISGHNGQPKSTEIYAGNPEYKKYIDTSPWWKRFSQEFRVYWDSIWGGGCALCCSTKNTQVHHRRYRDAKGSILGRETFEDCVLLCEKCHKRHHRYVNKIN